MFWKPNHKKREKEGERKQTDLCPSGSWMKRTLFYHTYTLFPFPTTYYRLGLGKLSSFNLEIKIVSSYKILVSKKNPQYRNLSLPHLIVISFSFSSKTEERKSRVSILISFLSHWYIKVSGYKVTKFLSHYDEKKKKKTKTTILQMYCFRIHIKNHSIPYCVCVQLSSL